MRERRRLLVGGALVVAIVLAGVGAASAAGLAIGPLNAEAGVRTPRFVDDSVGSGLQQVYRSEAPDDTVEDAGGGVAVFDCDGDGRPDLYAAGGATPAVLAHNTSTIGGALRFDPVTGSPVDLVGVTGAYPIDLDSDGNVDLVVLLVDGARVFRGLGGCRFEPAPASWNVPAISGPTTAFSATWEPGNTMPTLAFGHYVVPDLVAGVYHCPDGELVRPAASGAGWAAPVALSPGYCALSMLFSDWDGSGRRDLRVSNDRHYYGEDAGGEQLWRIDPGRAPRLYTQADGWNLLRIWGMGIASQDLSGDGLPDVYLTSQGANTLQSLAAGPSTPDYHDIGLGMGLAATRPTFGGDPLPSTAWHPEFEDVNNDGSMDLFVSKGNVSAVPDYAKKDPNVLFLGQPDGSFADRAEAAGLTSFDRARGAALADFNLDGLLDLAIVNLDAPVRVYRNVGSGSADRPVQLGNWVAVRLSQPGGNVDAIGSVVEVKAGDTVERHEVVVGGGHISGQLGWIHAGVGPWTKAEVRVTWPDGTVGPWQTVVAGGFYDLERGAASPAPFTPPAP